MPRSMGAPDRISIPERAPRAADERSPRAAPVSAEIPAPVGRRVTIATVSRRKSACSSMRASNRRLWGARWPELLGGRLREAGRGSLRPLRARYTTSTDVTNVASDIAPFDRAAPRLETPLTLSYPGG